ncbi:MAG TPA: endonuclease III [Syntrophomonadaceae bacterium]|nr:endonuclease III [Syntrophomonadaceae bacterium]HQE22573.1 endonuclease III [Syntrophomonadaceae bacterium]
MSKQQAESVLELLQQEYPGAGTQLNYHSLFELLVAVVLSAQSTDQQVNRVTPALFSRYPDTYAMAEAGIDELEEMIKSVGLYHSKARNLKNMAQILVNKYGGQVPGRFEQLLELPGVGRKTANVVIAVGFGGPGLGVDTHVHRVANRLGMVNSKDRNNTEKKLKEIISPEQWNQAHHLLIWHGRQVCKARKPKCHSCVLNNQCYYFKQQSKA